MEDITDKVLSKQTWVEENLERLLVMLEINRNLMFPSVHIVRLLLLVISVHHCWKHIPKNSVLNCIVVAIKAWELYKQGILKIEDIEDDFPLTHFQHLQRKGLRNQEQYINKAIKNMISSWQFPCIF